MSDTFACRRLSEETHVELTPRVFYAIKHTMDMQEVITVDPEILGGTPVFKGTRVPVKTIFEYLEDNFTLAEFLTCFPSVSRDMAIYVLESSEKALLASAA